MAEPTRIAEGIWAIATRTPVPGLPFTLCYVLVSPRGDLHVIDPGWAGIGSYEQLSRSFENIGLRIHDVRTVLATHFHRDHLGLSAELRERTGARLLLSTVECDVIARSEAGEPSTLQAREAQWETWGVPQDRRDDLTVPTEQKDDDRPVHADGTVDDGEILPFEGHSLEVVATPGHTQGHLCLADRDRQVVYTGDHVLPQIFSGIGIGSLPGHDPVHDFLTSLEKLSAFDAFDVLPGHEYGFTKLGKRRRQIAYHHVRRAREVSELLGELGSASIWQYARRVSWTRGWAALRGYALESALRQTALHREFVESGNATEWFERYPTARP
ncbi:MBL fold metallo-hydrolase [Microcella sp.]|uniref:MBL fold metallo-hydrolase n=1 Tax=Microcella sp. TaxID=1913979 RepID=UPI0025DEE48B|nr:MBL fold metallo-hydrolase [Microcella sp.]